MQPAYATLIIPVPVNRMFTYFIPEEMRSRAVPGKRVIVQFGARKFYTAVIYELSEKISEGLHPKSIDLILDEHPVVGASHLKFWKWISEYYMCSIGDVMKAALPSGLRIESETKIELHPDFSEEMLNELQMHEQTVVKALQEKDSLSVTEIQKVLGIKHVQHIIKNLITKQIAVSVEEYSEKYIPKKDVYISISNEFFLDETKLLQLSDRLSKKAPKQSDALVYFLHETTIVAYKPEILKKVLVKRCSLPAVQALIKKGVFIETEKVVSRLSEAENDLKTVTLNKHQEEAVDSIRKSFETKQVHLLHGITSSGKTEIYMRLIQETLEAGKQVLYLLPEIALTHQIIKRIQCVFGNAAGIWHHRFNHHEKVEIWNSINSLVSEKREIRIIIGTRSALFLPFTNLGLIIVDEEHDGSYKQSDITPRYHARDAAIMLAGILNARVLLGTATPSAETYLNVLNGRYGLTELFKRYREMPLPEVKIVDMRREDKTRKGAWYISSELKNAITETLDKKRQVILFQNRRGFVPIVQCTQCGWIPGCINCDISLTYHKKINQLKCHLCGHSAEIFERCPECGNTHIKFMGFGTERIEDEIKVLFPEAVVARMDTDTTKGRYSHQNIVSAFEEGLTDILVGTQMVSKGLDFEKVSLVGILNADNLFHFPDFRAFERGYQLLTQIIGRAGRHQENGLVILQTRKPEHPVISAAVGNNYSGFISMQLRERSLFRYPPFFRLILLSVRHRNIRKVIEYSENLKKLLAAHKDIFILGPEEPVYGKVKQFYIRNILIKIPRDQRHSQTRIHISALIDQFLYDKEHSGLRIIADADPV